MRRITFENGSVYHIYNRGVDKRIVFADKQDFFQLLQMLKYFNTLDTDGGLEKSKLADKKQSPDSKPLVEIIAYCLNGNHYHLLLRQLADDGISKFMQRVGTGYTMYFNQKNNRTGALFGGRFKAKLVDNEIGLDYVGVYVNLNNRVHNIQKTKSKITYVSSWNEYMNKSKLQLCKTKYLLKNFKTLNSYKKYALSTLSDIQILKKIKNSGIEL